METKLETTLLVGEYIEEPLLFPAYNQQVLPDAGYEGCGSLFFVCFAWTRHVH